MRLVLSKIGWFIRSIVRSLFLFFKGLLSAFKNAKQPSYYPEYQRKCLVRRILDGVGWAFSRCSDNKFYTAYGFDIKHHFSRKKDYVDENHFWAQIKKDNRLSNFSQIPILRDKYCFYAYLKSNGIPTPEVFAIEIGGTIFETKTFNVLNDEYFRNKKDFFVKEIDGECASYVKHIRNFQDFEICKQYIAQKRINCIFQEKVLQNEKMNSIYDGSINTLRIVTIYDVGSIHILAAVLRIGTKETGDVDNWAKGGYSVGIDDFGKLKKYGFKKPTFGLKEEKHKDSNVLFEGFEVPFFKEACELCIKAHSCFYTLGSIGWDVAITEKGPTLIEGNDNFEISLLQVSNGGLKKKWDDHIRLRLLKKK